MFSSQHLDWMPRGITLATISLLSPYEGEVLFSKFSKYSNQPKVKEFLLFCYTIPLEKIAMSIGAFECLGDIIQKEKNLKQ